MKRENVNDMYINVISLIISRQKVINLGMLN